jgi:transforming growth factor-beta-induced protein
MKLILVLSALVAFAQAQNGTNNETGGGNQTVSGTILQQIVGVVTGANPKPYNLSTLAGLGAQAPGVIGVLNGTGPTTLFAPTNAAFDELIASLGGSIPPGVAASVPEILKYHAVGQTIQANQISYNITPTLMGTPSNLTTLKNQALILQREAGVSVTGGSRANVIDTIQASNGVIHVVDKVILPPASISDTLIAEGYTDLAATLNATNLTSTVNGLAGATVFAPSNEALAAAKPILDKLNATQVDAILKYHVVPAVAYSTQLSNGQSIKTAQGENVTVTLAGNEVLVNDARVQPKDILASNGVIHAINKVLIPPSIQQALLPTMNQSIAAINDGTVKKDYSLSQFAALSGGVPNVQAILNNNSTATPNATLFAPTDAAFNALVASLGGSIPPNIAAVVPDILKYVFEIRMG